MKHNTTLPEEMYILHKDTLNRIYIIESTYDGPCHLSMILSIVLLAIALPLLIQIVGIESHIKEFKIMTKQASYIIIMLEIVLFIICICVSFRRQRKFQLLQEKYPMEFIVWKPYRYVLTTEYKVKEYDALDNNDRIIDIDMRKLKNKNPEIFRQLELRNKGYN